MAQGIDGIAAIGALDAGGYTVAVLGSGIDIVYPRQHAQLASEIASCGAIVTEFAPGTPPNARNFPARNRLISAFSEALVVVEAGENSGSLITARYALLQGKSLFAVPGDVDDPRSAGTNLLLRAGARMVLDTEDVLSHFRFLYRENMRVPAEALQYTGFTEEKLRAHGIFSAKKAQPRQDSAAGVEDDREERGAAEAQLLAEVSATLDAPRRKIYDMLPKGPFTVDVLVEAGVPANEAIAAMTLFELYGLITSRPGGTYLKK
jgi:DNA processing protein